MERDGIHRTTARRKWDTRHADVDRAWVPFVSRTARRSFSAALVVLAFFACLVSSIQAASASSASSSSLLSPPGAVSLSFSTLLTPLPIEREVNGSECAPACGAHSHCMGLYVWVPDDDDDSSGMYDLSATDCACDSGWTDAGALRHVRSATVSRVCAVNLVGVFALHSVWLLLAVSALVYSLHKLVQSVGVIRAAYAKKLTKALEDRATGDGPAAVAATLAAAVSDGSRLTRGHHRDPSRSLLPADLDAFALGGGGGGGLGSGRNRRVSAFVKPSFVTNAAVSGMVVGAAPGITPATARRNTQITGAAMPPIVPGTSSQRGSTAAVADGSTLSGNAGRVGAPLDDAIDFAAIQRELRAFDARVAAATATASPPRTAGMSRRMQMTTRPDPDRNSHPASSLSPSPSPYPTKSVNSAGLIIRPPATLMRSTTGEEGEEPCEGDAQLTPNALDEYDDGAGAGTGNASEAEDETTPQSRTRQTPKTARGTLEPQTSGTLTPIALPRPPPPPPPPEPPEVPSPEQELPPLPPLSPQASPSSSSVFIPAPDAPFGSARPGGVRAPRPITIVPSSAARGSFLEPDSAPGARALADALESLSPLDEYDTSNRPLPPFESHVSVTHGSARVSDEFGASIGSSGTMQIPVQRSASHFDPIAVGGGAVMLVSPSLSPPLQTESTSDPHSQSQSPPCPFPARISVVAEHDDDRHSPSERRQHADLLSASRRRRTDSEDETRLSVDQGPHRLLPTTPSILQGLPTSPSVPNDPTTPTVINTPRDRTAVRDDDDQDETVAPLPGRSTPPVAGVLALRGADSGLPRRPQGTPPVLPPEFVTPHRGKRDSFSADARLSAGTRASPIGRRRYSLGGTFGGSISSPSLAPSIPEHRASIGDENTTPRLHTRRSSAGERHERHERHEPTSNVSPPPILDSAHPILGTPSNIPDKPAFLLGLNSQRVDKRRLAEAPGGDPSVAGREAVQRALALTVVSSPAAVRVDVFSGKFALECLKHISFQYSLGAAIITSLQTAHICAQLVGDADVTGAFASSIPTPRVVGSDRFLTWTYILSAIVFCIISHLFFGSHLKLAYSMVGLRGAHSGTINGVLPGRKRSKSIVAAASRVSGAQPSFSTEETPQILPQPVVHTRTGLTPRKTNLLIFRGNMRPERESLWIKAFMSVQCLLASALMFGVVAAPEDSGHDNTIYLVTFIGASLMIAHLGLFSLIFSTSLESLLSAGTGSLNPKQLSERRSVLSRLRMLVWSNRIGGGLGFGVTIALAFSEDVRTSAGAYLLPCISMFFTFIVMTRLWSLNWRVGGSSGNSAAVGQAPTPIDGAAFRQPTAVSGATLGGASAARDVVQGLSSYKWRVARASELLQQMTAPPTGRRHTRGPSLSDASVLSSNFVE